MIEMTSVMWFAEELKISLKGFTCYVFRIIIYYISLSDDCSCWYTYDSSKNNTTLEEYDTPSTLAALSGTIIFLIPFKLD